jgi:hypothetical protein
MAIFAVSAAAGPGPFCDRRLSRIFKANPLEQPLNTNQVAGFGNPLGTPANFREDSTSGSAEPAGARSNGPLA